MTLHGWKFRKMEAGEDDRGHVETRARCIMGVYQRLNIVCFLQLSPKGSKLRHSTKLTKFAVCALPSPSITFYVLRLYQRPNTFTFRSAFRKFFSGVILTEEEG